MWIAFIFLYLWDTTQLNDGVKQSVVGCELLSFFCIFGIQHNITFFKESEIFVVNCFHFSVSLGYNTTTWSMFSANNGLWIAFIFLYLWDTTQLFAERYELSYGCELLSFFCIFGIQHNMANERDNAWGVVNCFHFSVSLGYNTTKIVVDHIDNMLWIAFIFLYLWDTTQLFVLLVRL